MANDDAPTAASLERADPNAKVDGEGAYLAAAVLDPDCKNHVGPGDEPAQAGDDGLDDLTIPDLRDLAADRGVELHGATRKADIVAALRGG